MLQINMKWGIRIACCVGAALALPASAHAQDVGPLVFFMVLPAILLGALFSIVLKFALLSLPRYRKARPRLRRFIGIALVDLAVWTLALPSGLLLRFGNRWVYKADLPLALISAIAVGYIVNHVTFHRAASGGAESVTAASMALVFVLTLLLPLLIIAFALVIFWLGSFISLSTEA
jgi:hypothetical protein